MMCIEMSATIARRSRKRKLNMSEMDRLVVGKRDINMRLSRIQRLIELRKVALWVVCRQRSSEMKEVAEEFQLSSLSSLPLDVD